MKQSAASDVEACQRLLASSCCQRTQAALTMDIAWHQNDILTDQVETNGYMISYLLNQSITIAQGNTSDIILYSDFFATSSNHNDWVQYTGIVCMY